jgi:uncharacterized coiled-coil protein SlyX
MNILLQEANSVSLSWATVVGASSGFGGLAMGWGMHRQALRDLAKRFDAQEISQSDRDKAITLLTANVTALTEMSKSQQKQLDRLTDITDRMARYPVAASSRGTWESTS